MKDSGQLHVGLGWWEMKMLLLFIFIVVMLGVGTAAGTNLRLQKSSAGNEFKIPVWRWGIPLNERLGVTFGPPWMMTEADLTWKRVVYNLISKPGFRWLFAELGLGVVATVILTRGAAWLFGKAYRGMVQGAEGLRTLASSTVRVQVAGSVMIVNSRGLIYAADVGGKMSGEEVYGFCLATVKISIMSNE
jgi:hypothetical protein